MTKITKTCLGLQGTMPNEAEKKLLINSLNFNLLQTILCLKTTCV